MSLNKLLEAALVLVFRFLLGWLFTIINYPVDEAFLNALTAAIVAWVLAQLGVETARALKIRGIH